MKRTLPITHQHTNFMKKNISLAIIPARGGSRGIPRKNLELIGEKPLVAHTIEHAKKAKNVDTFLVNSDDAEIRTVAASYGALTMNRPDMYAHDKILQEVDLLLKLTVEAYEKTHPEQRVDVVVLLYPTAPLRDVKAIDKAIELVRDEGYDSALSLFYDDSYLWQINEDGKTVHPTNYDPNKRMPRQKESWNQWVENKAVYAIKRSILFEVGRIGPNTGMVEMDKWRSIDIDNPSDLELARAVYKDKRSELDS